MSSYLSSNLNFAAAKNVTFSNTNNTKIIQKDEESGEEAGAEDFLGPNKRTPKNSIPHQHKIFYILLFGVLRYFAMFHYGRWTFSDFTPFNYINPCNGTNLMSFDEIDLLKQNITNIHEELKSISVVNRYHLNNNATAFLNDMHRNHTVSLINLEVELEYQRNEYFNCYVRNIQSFMAPQKFIVLGFISLMMICYLTLYYYMFNAQHYYMMNAKICKFNENQVHNFKKFFSLSIIMLFMDAMFVFYFFNELKLDNKYANFPL